MHLLIKFCDTLSGFLWSFPMLILLMGTHLYFTFRLGFIQKWLFRGIRLSFAKPKEGSGGVSPFAALATALAATIGTGNIIGISTAIAIGGPGAVFWCWVTGVLGMATCYGECLLSVIHQRRSDRDGCVGGPMYVLKYELHKPVWACLFSVAAVLASFGVGSSVQAQAISGAITRHVALSPGLIGLVAMIVAGFVILGGIRQISKICTFFVPFMSLFYLAGCFWLLVLNRAYLGQAASLIFRSAFSSRSLAGGVAGTAVLMGIRIGISRGLFTNEAGLGSFPMAAASARGNTPTNQSLISMTGPFWDTVVLCAVTGLVIVSSILKTPGAYQNISMDALCFSAFGQLPFLGEEILSLSLVLFAFATILGWCYYGECGVRFLVGERGLGVYRLLYLMFIYLGAVMSLDLVWGMSDLLNSFMALPNLICLWLLRKQVIDATKSGGLMR